MSLKAKIEAVVYAAEEPVTLAQLAEVFADEILEELAPTGSEEPAAEQQPAALEASEILFPVLSGAGTAIQDVPENGAPGSDVPQNLAPEAKESKKLERQRHRQVQEVLQRILAELIADYASGDRGMEVREIAGGYRMATKPEYHDAVRALVKSLKPPMKLSLQALETLAVIAYKQPVTAPEVSEIRGVDTGGVLGSLVSRKLITTAGRKPVVGRPILYKTTKEFLLRFGLKDLNDLPSMEEFEKMAGELAQTESEDFTADRSADLDFSDSQEAAEPATPETEEVGPPSHEHASPEGNIEAEKAAVEPAAVSPTRKTDEASS